MLRISEKKRHRGMILVEAVRALVQKVGCILHDQAGQMVGHGEL